MGYMITLKYLLAVVLILGSNSYAVPKHNLLSRISCDRGKHDQLIPQSEDNEIDVFYNDSHIALLSSKSITYLTWNCHYQRFENIKCFNDMNDVKVKFKFIVRARGIYGSLTLREGLYIAFIVKSSKVMDYIQRVEELVLLKIPEENQKQNDNMTFTVDAFKDTFNRHSFLFSTNSTYDVTKGVQQNRIGYIRSKDEKYFWNKNLLQPLLDASVEESLLIPVVNGWCLTKTLYINNTQYQLSLVTRRSRYNQGTRYAIYIVST